MTFKELNLIEPILRAVTEKGYDVPTPIQEQAIPPVLAGHDLLGCAQTGTGKTAAFTLPILQLLAAEPANGKRPIRALVLTPTRELAIQIDECCRDYARHTSLRHTVIFGGVNQRPQVDALKRGVDLLVATPGRLLDLIGQGYISLADIRFFVLDEADRMLDMGFIHDIRRILPLLPQERQTLFFSATMPSDIVTLASTILRDPVHITVTPQATVVETIRQEVRFAEKADKKDCLIDLLRDRSEGSVLVFSRTKHGADRIARILTKAGIEARAIHGDKSQGARERAMNDFRSGDCRVLIATDIAARGIDISELPLVVNYDLPEVAETYVHRIGRTGRAGCEGTAISFCSEEERPLLKDIQKLTGLLFTPSADGVSGELTPGGKQEPVTQQPAKKQQAKAKPAARPQNDRNRNERKQEDRKPAAPQAKKPAAKQDEQPRKSTPKQEPRNGQRQEGQRGAQKQDGQRQEGQRGRRNPESRNSSEQKQELRQQGGRQSAPATEGQRPKRSRSRNRRRGDNREDRSTAPQQAPAPAPKKKLSWWPF